jgi:hypothetical protein
LDALLVELGNDIGRIGDGTEEPIQFGHDHDGFVFLGGGQESASRGATGERLASADCWILVGAATPPNEFTEAPPKMRWN